MSDAKRIIIASEENDDRKIELDALSGGKIAVPVTINDATGAIISSFGGSAGTTPYIYEISMADKSAVYSKDLPDGTKQVTIKLRAMESDLRISWVAGFSTYLTIMVGAVKTLTGVNLTSKTLYFQAPDADNQTAEIEVIV